MYVCIYRLGTPHLIWLQNLDKTKSNGPTRLRPPARGTLQTLLIPGTDDHRTCGLLVPSDPHVIYRLFQIVTAFLFKESQDVSGLHPNL